MWSATNCQYGDGIGFPGGHHRVKGVPVFGSTSSTGRQPNSRRSCSNWVFAGDYFVGSAHILIDSPFVAAYATYSYTERGMLNG